MKILIITTCYPPDTAIAAVRPYMFAKYLTQYGHDVTVLRPGLIQQSADKTFSGHESIRVISYLGDNSPAERFERKNLTFQKKSDQSKRSRISFLPESLRHPLAAIYHTLVSPYEAYIWLKNFENNRFVPMQKTIDSLSGEHFDVVFSTVGDIENIWGGEYARSVFGCKWFLDFRDPIEGFTPSSFPRFFSKRLQRRALCKADLCSSVSDDLSQHLSRSAGGKTVHTIYNGYAPFPEDPPSANTSDKNIFSLCYTGLIYAEKQDFTPALQAIQHLQEQNKINLSKVRLHYAGNDFSHLEEAAKKLGIEEILVNHGYVSRKEAAQIQQSVDLYAVLSWNTKSSQGILTGKFYEGIRAKKPILSIISGNVPYSELSQLQDKYQYGFCYECCREKEQFQQLCDYLEALYNEKMTTGKIAYNPDPALETDFRYDTLAKKLEALCLQLLEEGSGDTP